MDLAEKQSNMTHYDSLSAKCCQIYSEAVSDILSGKDLKQTIINAFSLLNLPESELLSPTCDSDGYVLNTLTWVLHLCYTSDSFEQVVVRAANLGGDTDTIGAIAGGLYGVYCGYDNLPTRYVDALLNKNELDSIAIATYNYRFKNEE
jgi:ADP-ribosyl-[dinitrogen reductase] hydrolase